MSSDNPDKKNGITRRGFVKTSAGAVIGATGKAGDIPLSALTETATAAAMPAVKLSASAARAVHSLYLAYGKVLGLENISTDIQRFLSEAPDTATAEDFLPKITANLIHAGAASNNYATALPAAHLHQEEVEKAQKGIWEQQRTLFHSKWRQYAGVVRTALQAWIDDPGAPASQKALLIDHMFLRRLSTLLNEPDPAGTMSPEEKLEYVKTALEKPWPHYFHAEIVVHSLQPLFQKHYAHKPYAQAFFQEIQRIETELPSVRATLWTNAGFMGGEPESNIYKAGFWLQDKTAGESTYYKVSSTDTPEHARGLLDVFIRNMPGEVREALIKCKPTFGHLPLYKRLVQDLPNLLDARLPQIAQEVKSKIFPETSGKHAKRETARRELPYDPGLGHDFY